jgi:hypothetical protein
MISDSRTFTLNSYTVVGALFTGILVPGSEKP